MFVSASMGGGNSATAAESPAPVAETQDSKTIEISGKVIDTNGQPIIGATVFETGTANGITTDLNGGFTLTVTEKATLEFSYVGYKPQTLPASQGMVVTLEEALDIDAVVVVGYGVQKKANLSGAVATVKMDEVLGDRPQPNVAAALQGAVPGLMISSSSGSTPGQTGKSIQIRGTSSLGKDSNGNWAVAGLSPLILIDNVEGDIDALNPNDIESMTVLKDAASNALYGARGANGVVMITTKKAKSKDAIITVDAKWGVNSRAVKDYEYITNPAQFYETHYNALKNYYLDSGMSTMEAHLKANQNLTGSANDGGLGYMVYTVPEGQEFIGINGKVNPQATLGRRLVYEGQEYYVRPDDWTDAAFRTSLRQEYNISIAGSGDKTSVYASFGYLNNEGIAYNSDMDRFTTRLKLDYQAKDWLKM